MIDSNIRHDAVPVPSSVCPFNEQQLILFKQGLQLLREHEEVPLGYGIHFTEWETSGYRTTEAISVGLRRLSFPISLPDSIWRPRAEDWTRALYLMQQILLV